MLGFLMFMGMLLLWVLIVILVLGVLLLFFSEIDTFIMFDFKLKKVFQHLDFIEKDMEYAIYVRDVVGPREQEKKRAKRHAEATEKVEKKLFEAVRAGEEKVSINSAQIGNLNRDEMHDFLVKLASKYGFTVEKRDEDWMYETRYEIWIEKEKSAEN